MQGLHRLKFPGVFLLIFTFTLFASSGVAYAQVGGSGGLIIQLDSRINVEPIRNLSYHSDVLIVDHKAGRKRIRLPAGSLPHIVEWAKQADDGPLVVSTDILYLGTLPDGPYVIRDQHITKGNAPERDRFRKTYLPEQVDSELGLSLHLYDQFAQNFATGILPVKSREHYPDLSILPQSVAASLVESKDPNHSRLFRKFTSEPSCISRLWIKAVPSKEGFPVRLEVRVNRWFIAYNWGQEYTVLSDEDATIASLPYKPLADDIEKRWDVYRKAFVPLEELSSLCEAFAILRMIRLKQPPLWTAFVTTTPLDAKLKVIAGRGADLDAHLPNDLLLQRDTWIEQCEVAIGKQVDSVEKANLTLGLLMNRWEKRTQLLGPIARLKSSGEKSGTIDSPWWHEIQKQAEKEPTLKAKLQLALGLHEGASKSLESFKAFFQTIKEKIPDDLRLWSQGIHWVSDYCNHIYKYSPDEVNAHRELVKQQRAELLVRVSDKAMEVLKPHSPDTEAVRSLIADIYGARLLDHAMNEYPERDRESRHSRPEFARFVLWIARAHQSYCEKAKPKDPELLHSHYRFLTYLQQMLPVKGDEIAPIIAQIQECRKDIFGQFLIASRR